MNLLLRNRKMQQPKALDTPRFAKENVNNKLKKVKLLFSVLEVSTGGNFEN